MGYGLNRFVTHVDPNLLCSICAGVLEEAVITPCGHSFCNECLHTWLDRPNTNSCPSCRSGVSERDVIPVLALRGMIDGLAVYCDNNENGCKMVLKLDKLTTHLQVCEFALIQCGACGRSVRRCELPDHHENCEVIKDLVAKHKRREEPTIDGLTKQIAVLEVDLNKTKKALMDSEGDVRRVKSELRELQFQLEMRLYEESDFDADWDPDYSYGYSPASIAQLASLVTRNLLTKPYYIDRNRIFNAIKRCYDYYHSYAGYSQDVHMLLATSYASNWFTENQRSNFDLWLRNLARDRFLTHT
ncbi:E3 ubiquitin-protein ligase NRDP1-like [Montipora capricornis]|uniref:E3 ubiquitin-protein ligase NRDP1-like n=1 Tax=Montipora foliosa TaxID=591990 RepID=UPI0035F1E1A9